MRTRWGIAYWIASLFAIIATAPSVLAQTAETPAPSVEIPPLISSADFVDPGYFRRPMLSPDGQKMVFRVFQGEQTWMAVRNVEGGPTQKIAVPKKHSLNWYRWAGNTQVLVSITGVGKLFDEEVPLTVLLVYDVQKNAVAQLGLRSQGLVGDDLLYVEPEGKYVLLALQPSIYDYPQVYQINIADNKATKIVDGQSSIWDWIADDQGVVRMGLAYSRNSTKIYYRSNASEKFKQIGKLDEKDDDETRKNNLLEVSRVVSGKDEGYVLSNKETGRFAVYRFNYLTREIGEKIFGVDKNDVTDFELNDEGTTIESVTYTDDRDRVQWFDDYFSKQQRKLDKAMPGQEAWIQSHSRDRNRMIIFTTSSTDPGSYFFYDVAAKKMDRIAGINDKVDPSKLAITKYVHYTARDGLSIPAYLTLPVGRDPKNLPLIILPHGGPFGVRDTLDFNSEVQFLANRGYAVLQPNYRGSESYGEAFYKKGDGQIGRAMQDDIDDGMDWLAKEGIIDPARVCVVGSSYGGYAALWSVIRNPERYRCAASFAGVTDYKKQLKYNTKSLKSRYAREWQSKVQGEKDFDLDLVSPAKNVATLNRPILLTHGDDDSTVPFSQYKDMVSALKKAGKTAETHIYEGEGHGFDDPANEQDWLDRLETFLNKNNPADAPKADALPKL